MISKDELVAKYGISTHNNAVMKELKAIQQCLEDYAECGWDGTTGMQYLLPQNMNTNSTGGVSIVKELSRCGYFVMEHEAPCNISIYLDKQSFEDDYWLYKYKLDTVGLDVEPALVMRGDVILACDGVYLNGKIAEYAMNKWGNK